MQDSQSMLVSVIVLTFNQENLIIECLESIKRQTYSKIELIISDDASTDNTYSIVKEWVDVNQDALISITANSNPQNLGIAGNHSFAVQKAKGEYIKYIGGDDILHPRAIERMVQFTLENNLSWIVCQVAVFQSSINDATDLVIHPWNLWTYKKTNKIQLLSFLNGNKICAPGVFIKKSLLEQVDYFGHTYKTREDYHTWIALLIQGNCVRFLPDTLVYWRRHPNSVSYSIYQNNNAKWFVEEIHTLENIVVPITPWWAFPIRIHTFLKLKRFRKILLRNVKSSKLDRIYTILDPIFWISKCFEILENLE